MDDLPKYSFSKLTFRNKGLKRQHHLSLNTSLFGLQQCRTLLNKRRPSYLNRVIKNSSLFFSRRYRTLWAAAEVATAARKRTPAAAQKLMTSARWPPPITTRLATTTNQRRAANRARGNRDQFWNENDSFCRFGLYRDKCRFMYYIEGKLTKIYRERELHALFFEFEFKFCNVSPGIT